MSSAKWDFPLYQEFIKLYELGYEDLANRAEAGDVRLASSEGALIAYEVLIPARAIRVLEIISLDGAEPNQQAALEYIREESLVWSCPIILMEQADGTDLQIS